MPPKKKTPRNAFYYYMENFKKEQEKRGIRMSMKDVADMAGPSWKALPPEEKEVYTRMASRNKALAANDLANKFTSLGVSYKEIQQEKLEKDEKMALMVTSINKTIDDLNFDLSFRYKKFYLCHVSYFYKNDQDVFKPAEIGLSEFSLKEGVCRTFHRFVDPGALETGFRYAAKSLSERTHRIPIDEIGHGWKGEKDYFRLYYDIVNFLTDNQKNPLPPVYTMPDDPNSLFSLKAVVSTLSTLCEASDEATEPFRVYELPYLFHAIRIKCVKESFYKTDIDSQMLTVPMALHELSRDTFSYEKGMACDFHEENDVPQYCSLSIVIRWVYHICSWTIEFIPDNIVPGKHEPLRAGCRQYSPKRQPMMKKPVFIESAESLPSTSGYPPKPVVKPPYISNGRGCGSSQPLGEEMPFESRDFLSQPAGFSGYNQAGNSQNLDGNWPSIESSGRGRGLGRIAANRPLQENWALVAGRGKRMNK